MRNAPGEGALAKVEVRLDAVTNLPPADDTTPTPRIACVVYAAKSTEDLRGSIPTQLADCRAAAEAQGSRVVAEYNDEAASAYSGDRGPGLRAAMEHAERLAAEHGSAELYVQHSDRAARGDGKTARHVVEIALWGMKAGVVVRSVQDPDTFRDLLYAVVTGQRNHEDSARKSKAVASGLRRAAERGEWAGGILADGYRVLRSVDDHGRVSRRVDVDPDRAPIYRLMFDLALRGYADRAIVLELDRHGYRTAPRKAGAPPRPFDANRVRQTLATPFYAGLATYRGEVVGTGSWPAYVELAQFRELRHQRAQRARVEHREVGRPPEGYVLARLAVCGTCGARMDVVTSRHLRTDGSRARRYVCRAHRERPQDCAAQPIDGTVVDRGFVANLEHFVGDLQQWWSRLTDSREREVERLQREVAAAREDLDRGEALLSRMRARYERALSDAEDDKAEALLDTLGARRADNRAAEQRLTACMDALGDAEARGGSSDPVLDLYNGLRAEIAGRVEGARGDVKRLNVAMREFFDRVELTAVEEGIRILPVISDAAVKRIAGDERIVESPGAIVTDGHELVAPPLHVRLVAARATEDPPEGAALSLEGLSDDDRASMRTELARLDRREQGSRILGDRAQNPRSPWWSRITATPCALPPFVVAKNDDDPAGTGPTPSDQYRLSRAEEVAEA